MDINYIARRLTFSMELKGTLPKINYFFQELLSLSTRISPTGIQQVTWKGPKGDIILNYYDSLACWRAEVIDLHMLDIDLPNKESPLIIDIGSNLGFSVLWFKYQYPDAIIHAYEPVKKSFDILEKNVVDNDLHNCSLKNFGVSDKDEFVNIYHHPGGAGLGDNVFKQYEGDEKEEIRLVNLDPEFDHIEKFDLLKLDAEGSEYPILKNCNFWKKADKIIIEFHENFKPDNLDYDKIIRDAGFYHMKKVGEGKVYVDYYSKDLTS